MTPRDLRNIRTTGNSCRDALPCANMVLKPPRYFYLLMENPPGRYFQVRCLYCQVAQSENTYSCILKVTGQVWESQKRTSITLITATTSVHLRKPVSFNQPSRKRWGAKLVDVKHLPHKVFLS